MADVIFKAYDLPVFDSIAGTQVIAKTEDGQMGYVKASQLQTTLDGNGLATDADIANLQTQITSGSFDKVYSTNNGNGQNFKVGDDVWIGDRNVSNTVMISGVQEPTSAILQFGSGSQPSIAHLAAGAPFPASGSALAITGSILLGHNGHMYFFNGGAANGGWAQVI